MKKTCLLLFILALAANSFAQSNLFIDNSYTLEEMIQDFFDNPAVTISNVVYQGDENSVAFFDGGNTDLGLGAGILFTTGTALGVADAAPVFLSQFLGNPGDPDLELLMGDFYSYDATIIEFDFTVAFSDTFKFNYVFGSEEYPEFTCTLFNDAFGFLISGPGINGPYSNNAINICMIPNSNEAVAINTINDNLDCGNPQYYINNENGQHVVYDGFTTPLPASFYTIGEETYHAKLIIGDGSDAVFDSGVFLSVNSLGADSLLIPPSQFTASVNNNVVEVTNTSKYAREWSWDFGNGMVSSERHPQPVHYDAPGTYTISLVTSNYCCSDTYSMTVEVGAAPMVVAHDVINNPLACFGDQNASVSFDVSGGLPPYHITWDPDVPGNENLGAGTYEYVISDNSGQQTSLTVVITQPEALILETSATPALEGQSDGTATAMVAGGTAPYSYLWSNEMTMATIVNLEGGNYTVSITDANGCTIDGEVVVDMTTGLNANGMKSGWKVFPNPVSGAFKLVNTEDVQVIEMKLFDASGKMYVPTFNTHGQDIKVNLSDQLTSGLYMLQIKSSDGNIYVARFVKQ